MKRLYDSLTWKQIASILLAAAAVIASLVTFSHWHQEQDFRPLFSSLSPEDAAAVLAKVREGGSEFRLSDNGTSVLVPSAKVAELRLQLAAAGVPKSGRIGYELFDKTNFGASDFAEQINYHRALEGELERSVISLSAVEQARVHITFPKESVFLETRQPAKASVLVKLRPGMPLSNQNVLAICQLTASAVEGLAPEAVSVVDMRGNLLNRARKVSSGPDDSEPSEGNLEYRQKIERDLLAKINTTLEPLLGANRFRATASVECDFTSGEQSEESFDPNKSVMVTSQKTEDITGGSSASGVPGTASNLPRPTGRPASGSTGTTRRTENISYQSSHVVRKMRLPQGAVKRMSVSLLVDQQVRWEGVGAKLKRVIEPPSAEKLKTIHDLVAGVIGFSTERGDQLVVECLPFEATLNPEQLPDASKPAPVAPAGQLQVDQILKNQYVVIALGSGLLFSLVVLGLVLKLRRQKIAVHAQMIDQITTVEKKGENLAKQIENQLAEQAAIRERQESDALNALKVSPITKKTEVLSKHIAEQAKKDSTVMAHVMRSWMHDPQS
jgi:flagellar M-ring protein FliF